MKASPIYAAQSPEVQEQLVVDYDKELGIRANRNVQAEVNKIKNTLRARKQAAKDIATVKKTKWHKFHTLNGVIFEEISTTHYNNDSFYEDDKISALKRKDRKTIVKNWEC